MSARSSTPSEPWRRVWLVALALLVLACGQKRPDDNLTTIRIGAASDLSKAFEEVAKAYEKRTGKKTKLTFGATGNLSKQIIDGAPFDLFAAANVSFVDEVVQKGMCDGATQKLYARGHIVIYSKTTEPPQSLSGLTGDGFKKIAIANPEHAPYGKAAKEALEKEGVYDKLKDKIVFGENIAQTMKFADSGNVDAAIVALSLAIVADGKYTAIDESLHNPLDQALVVCGKGTRADLGKGFADFVASDEGRDIMRRYGFLLPGETLPTAEK